MCILSQTVYSRKEIFVVEIGREEEYGRSSAGSHPLLHIIQTLVLSIVLGRLDKLLDRRCLQVPYSLDTVSQGTVVVLTTLAAGAGAYK